MKRLIILSLTVACLVVPSHAQRRARVTQRKIIQLTEPDLTGTVPFEQVLAKRRSVVRFTNEDLKPSQISQLAWAGQGITEPQMGLRTAPSIGNVFPIDLILATREGTFAYNPTQNTLEQISAQDIRVALAGATAMPETVAEAPCSFILAGSLRRENERFPDNARTYLYLEAGQIAQNIQLEATAMDLGSTAVPILNTVGIRKVARLFRGLDPLYMVCVGHPAATVAPETAMGQTGAAGKKAVLIIPGQNFQDEELFGTKRVLDAALVQTFIASTRRGMIPGSLGNIAEANILLDRLKVAEYDAVIFIGGVGAAEYVRSPTALNIAREAVRNGKVLGAIGVAPTILANAGVLTGIRVTSFLSERNALVQAGAIYTGAPVERDRLIVTATGPAAVVPFGRAIVDAIAGM
ncbi:MAG: DJ-1/PfpI family protein [Sedimentisphaerales bacterium]|jgi:protease I